MLEGKFQSEALMLLSYLATKKLPRSDPNSRIHIGIHEIEPEMFAEKAIDILEKMGTAEVVPIFIQALEIEPTRWAYAGWALVRLAKKGNIAARRALEIVAGFESSSILSKRAHKFLEYVAI